MTGLLGTIMVSTLIGWVPAILIGGAIDTIRSTHKLTYTMIATCVPVAIVILGASILTAIP